MKKFLKELNINWTAYIFYFVVVTLIGLEALAAIAFLPTKVTEIFQKRDQAKQKQEQVAAFAEALSGLKAADPAQTQELLTKVLAAMPDEKKVSGVVSGMTKLASSSGLVVTDLEFSPGAVDATRGGKIEAGQQEKIDDEKTNLREIPAALSVTATVESLTEFLDRLRGASQMIGVDGLQYSDNQTGQVSATIAISIYFQPRDFTTFSWEKFKLPTESEIATVKGLPGTDIFVLTGQ